MTVFQVSISKVFKQPSAVAFVCFKGAQRFIAAWPADHDAWPASLGTRLLVAQTREVGLSSLLGPQLLTQREVFFASGFSGYLWDSVFA